MGAFLVSMFARLLFKIQESNMIETTWHVLLVGRLVRDGGWLLSVTLTVLPWPECN